MPLSERLKENTGQYQMEEYVFKTNKLNFVYMIHWPSAERKLEELGLPRNFPLERHILAVNFVSGVSFHFTSTDS